MFNETFSVIFIHREFMALFTVNIKSLMFKQKKPCAKLVELLVKRKRGGITVFEKSLIFHNLNFALTVFGFSKIQRLGKVGYFWRQMRHFFCDFETL